ncbi:hypothetical protein LIER_23039 [Lithospermum erythrorhizon]|uniref:Ubiquitin-like protease family profile domain-containing protein n=1 Tax=Lithospermum erythrorhizon TaxID=34254 RepID=A0AAV3QW02_LITER
MLHIPRSVSIKGQQYSIPQTLLTRQGNGRLPDFYSILLPREMVRQTIFHPGHVHNLKPHEFELAIHKLNNEIHNELNIHRTINRSPQIIELDESDVDDNEDEVVVEPSDVVSQRPIIVERPSNVVFMGNGHGQSLGAEQSTLTMVPKVSGTEIYPAGNVPKNKQISAVPKPPFHPSTDFYYDHSKYSLLSSWIDKNSHRSDEIGLVPIIQQYDSISAKKLHQICSNDWLSNEDTDAILQLINLQAKRYPGMYKSIKWTCLGSLYNVAVQSEYNIFIENREKEEGGIGKKIDVDLYNFVMGKNKSWESKAWCECDYVFGIENIDNGHWVAYAYDLKNKTFVQLNPVTPFTITVESVPQQHNTHDCGVYACKFVQCLAMQDGFSKLAAARFPDYRKKLAIDLIKWTRTSNDMFAFHELQIKT